MIDPQALQWLRCPIDPKRNAALLDEETHLTCSNCKVRFRIRDGIPNLIADEAGQKAASTPKELSPPQGDLANQTEKVKTELLDTEKDASQPLDDAKKNMLDAKGKLDANDAKRANPAQLEEIMIGQARNDGVRKKLFARKHGWRSRNGGCRCGGFA